MTSQLWYPTSNPNGVLRYLILSYIEMHQSEVSIIVVAYLWCLTGASIEAPEAPFLILYNKGASL